MSGVTKKDVELVVDYALTMAQAGAAATKWRWDDTVVSWVVAGRDGFVRMVCRMFGIPMDLGAAGEPEGALVILPMRGEITAASLGVDDPQAASIPPRLLQLLQFVLNILAKWVGPIAPVPTPKE